LLDYRIAALDNLEKPAGAKDSKILSRGSITSVLMPRAGAWSTTVAAAREMFSASLDGNFSS